MKKFLLSIIAVLFSLPALAQPQLSNPRFLSGWSNGGSLILQTEKGSPNGVASLDSSGFVPTIQLPPSITGGLAFQGNWNASTNTPALVSSTGTVGQYFFVSVAGSTTLNGTNSWAIGDLVLFSSGVWNKIPGPGAGAAVTSVAGLTGAITAPNLVTQLFATGNLNFGGTSQRITGDMSNATVASRLAFQTSTTNGNTSLNIIPNGTSQISALAAYSTAGMTNSSVGGIIQTGAETQLVATVSGTGTFGPLEFWTNGAERARFDTFGRFGIGRTPTTYPLEVQGNIWSNGALLLNTTAGAGLAGTQLNAAFTPGSNLPVWGFLESESLATGAGFHLPFVVQENGSGSGNRQTFTSLLNISGSSVGNQLVAGQFATTIQSGSSGSAFGSNSVAIANAGALSSSEVVGSEINTTVGPAAVARKVGLQIVDVGGGGAGSSIDAGIWMGLGSGAVGFQTGIQFNGQFVKTTGQLIAGPPAGVDIGLDFSATTFASYAMRSNGFSVTGGGQMNAAAINVAGNATLSGGIVGVANTTSAGAGTVGEIVTANLAPGLPIPLTTGNSFNVISISLTAGDWDVSAMAGFTGQSSTAVSYGAAGISTTSATLPSASGTKSTLIPSGATAFAFNNLEFEVPLQRVSLASTTTVYLVSNGGFSGGTMSAYGAIRARRVR